MKSKYPSRISQFISPRTGRNGYKSAILKKVRKIEIKTRRLSDHVFGGEYHSTFKGRGMTFSEVRQYQFGDDVRSIDWNVTGALQRTVCKSIRRRTGIDFDACCRCKWFGSFWYPNPIQKRDFNRKLQRHLLFQHYKTTTR